MEHTETYRSLFLKHLEKSQWDQQPQNLYAPITYIMGLGGKRLRPVLTLMATEFFGEAVEKGLDAAMTVEVFHNFSLVHDDIMDAAPLRRGKTTVHQKWDVNTGILSGDAMLILAYGFLEPYPDAVFARLARVFGKMALQVCEGQQYDMDFEDRDDVTLAEYLKMIEYKTAVLVGTALEMGAIVAGASHTDQEGIYAFGRDLGLAFQLQDDYLDAFGDPKTFGKQVGGDIMANKKTYLYLKALELADADVQRELSHLYSIAPTQADDKITRVKELFVQTGAVEQTQEAVTQFTQKALTALEGTSLSSARKQQLQQFAYGLMGRSV